MKSATFSFQVLFFCSEMFHTIKIAYLIHSLNLLFKKVEGHFFVNKPKTKLKKLWAVLLKAIVAKMQ